MFILYSVSERFNLFPLKTIRFEKHFHQKRNIKQEMVKIDKIRGVFWSLLHISTVILLNWFEAKSLQHWNLDFVLNFVSPATSNQSGALSLVQICRDTVLWLVEPFYAGAKVYAITTHLKVSKIPPGVVIAWQVASMHRKDLL